MTKVCSSPASVDLSPGHELSYGRQESADTRGSVFSKQSDGDSEVELGSPQKVRQYLRRFSGKRKALEIEANAEEDSGRRASYGGSKFGKRPRFVPPKNFLLGGNIRDPLNLQSISGRGSKNATPTDSPRSGTPATSLNDPIEILIPRSSRDPLNLERAGAKPEHMRHRHSFSRRKRHRRDSWKPDDANTICEESKRREESFSDSELHSASPAAVASRKNYSEMAGQSSLFSPPRSFSPSKRPRLFSAEAKLLRAQRDPIVSPVSQFPKSLSESPQKPVSHDQKTSDETKKRLKSPAKPKQCVERGEEKSTRAKKDPARFKYGNYNQYYGKRLPDKNEDPRLTIIKKEWVDGKDVLDIGCNVGHVTLFVAREFKPKSILGLDIDGHLIGVARKNVLHYLDAHNLYAGVQEADAFPNNVRFRQGNYVLAEDSLLQNVLPEYDVILALSITKWVQLNWGDAGLKRLFKRIYKNLRPEGVLILEPQPFDGYNKRKKLTVGCFYGTKFG